MRRPKFPIPLSIVLFISLTLAGTYYTRLYILQRAMLSAMELQDPATIASLARSWPSPVNASDADGFTPLHVAVHIDDLFLAKELLALGAAVSAGATWDPWTPLHYVMFARGQNNARAMALLLLRNGAEATGKFPHDNQTFLHIAVTAGWHDVAELLVAKGADVRAQDEHGWTPLHWVQSVETATLLLDRGADVNAADRKGLRPLHYAAPSGDRQLVELLIARGADVNAKTLDGKTVLKYVRENPYGMSPEWALDPVIDILLEHGATE